MPKTTIIWFIALFFWTFATTVIVGLTFGTIGQIIYFPISILTGVALGIWRANEDADHSYHSYRRYFD